MTEQYKFRDPLIALVYWHSVHYPKLYIARFVDLEMEECHSEQNYLKNKARAKRRKRGGRPKRRRLFFDFLK